MEYTIANNLLTFSSTIYRHNHIETNIRRYFFIFNRTIRFNILTIFRTQKFYSRR